MGILKTVGCSMLLFTAVMGVNAQGANTSNPGPEKVIYLTFDDGPLDGSEKINDAIVYEKVPITVLLVGKHAEAMPDYVDLYKKNAYIEVGNHSYSHARNHYSKFYFDPAGVLEDFLKSDTIINSADRVARLPGRNMWRIGDRKKDDIASGSEAADLLAENSFEIYGWDMEWFHDPKTAEPVGTAEELFHEIEKHLDRGRTFTKGHLVLLCHDEMFSKDYEETELKKLIELLKTRKDVQFGRLKDYPKGS
ncbi:polysaccharide deacetylase family protein [Robiginitalea aurantiaca]|uniref:Polysaccharide deacetylase family protein n=1 Tax=Robiginitalea aurantiaca TaxID=3056915 RepID=A0ABT7WCG2_9FLAO|nr:polysaccharide deacetylase family protein [Robiginitalea aurantiaca]MDM9630596.1 polysaccharide deacetylase family protein [Robiginitalea aurantiaca]